MLSNVEIALLFLFILTILLFQVMTMFHYKEYYEKVGKVDSFSDGRSTDSPVLG